MLDNNCLHNCLHSEALAPVNRHPLQSCRRREQRNGDAVDLQLALSLFCQSSYCGHIQMLWGWYSNSSVSCVILTMYYCVIVWTKRCSGRTSASHNRSDAAVQPGMQLRFILSLLFILPVYVLLYRPLWCSTDRCCVLILPLCRPEVVGEWVVILSGFSYIIFSKHTLPFFFCHIQYIINALIYFFLNLSRHQMS